MEKIERVKAYYESENRKEDKARLARLEKATKLIEKDKAKQERAELAKRGVIRGRKG
jgi:hypothetical protein